MKNRMKFIIGLMFIPAVLFSTGCQIQEQEKQTLPEPVSVKTELDERAKAEAELLGELGIDSTTPLTKSEPNDLPPVLIMPPELPKTDVNLPDISK